MDKNVGVLGGGQLGRMLQEAANRLNVKLITLDHGPDTPSKQINARSSHIDGSFTDPKAIRLLAENCDILTIEIEHVDTDVLEDLSTGTETRDDWRLIKSTKVEVQPNWRTIRVIQDKYDQKEHLINHGIPTTRSVPLGNNSIADMQHLGEDIGYPVMLKSRTGAYDGRGNYAVKNRSDMQAALDTLRDRPLYAEEWATFELELAVMVVKVEDDAAEDWQQATMAFPVAETIHEESICKLVYAPARNVSASTQRQAQVLARRAVAGFWGKGVFGVEMFLLSDGELLINEIAPRPHNSGHYTIEACPLSQYDAHLRAILGLPIPEESLQFNNRDTYSVMLNILGGAQSDSHLQVAQQALSIGGASIHLYGKGEARPGRKMGHITVLASSMHEAQSRLQPLINLVDQARVARKQGLSDRIQTSANSHNTALVEATSAVSPIVAVTMGSDSDRSVLSPGIGLLKELKIPFSVTITSAHRTPERMFQFAKVSASQGIRVIIAAAGGAAHLPGMVAANTWLPVIGVPVKGSSLDGMDSLLSIVQMPKGCPVATVAINNSVNAAQLAARILATSDVIIRKRLEEHLANQTASVLKKADRMSEEGLDFYGLDQ